MNTHDYIKPYVTERAELSRGGEEGFENIDDEL
jgi:hypothetical protein